MKDTLETKLPQESSEFGNENKEVISAETETTERLDPLATEEVKEFAFDNLSKEAIVERLKELVEQADDSSKAEVDALKQAYYKLRRIEVEELKKSHEAEEGVEFLAPEDPLENELKQLILAYKEKRASVLAEEDRIKNENYAKKLRLLDQLKELINSQDEFGKVYNDFKEIQQAWKEIKDVPSEHVNELWKSYQYYSEIFYDILKINNQFRDYDFKKNLELKTELCESVEKLTEETDVVSAFHQLQKLHQEWREIGPVAKEQREALWLRFKTGSTLINKKHQEHFESLKKKEQSNLEAKTAICEKIESIDLSKLTTFKDWEEKNKEVLDMQSDWRKIGFAPKKYNVKIFERFRAACDLFFDKKSKFYKHMKEEMDQNLQKKRDLCERAEALKDNTDWKETTDKFIALQKEWKTVGSVARKHSDSVWKRFISACDYFFEQKNKHSSSQKSHEVENLEAKKAIIVKIKDIGPETDPTVAISTIRAYMDEWNKIGHVPFKEKDKTYKEYHEALDKQFDHFKVDQSERRLESFKSTITDIAGHDNNKNKLYNEREKLMRQFDRMKNEVHTYENNIGFLSVSSKGGGGLLKDMNRKIEKLKVEMDLIIKKIEAIDENL